MNDDQLLRYSRHILLPEVGHEGQQKLLDATVLIVGLGGLGSPAALYLAAAGTGTLLLADFDVVELSNLQRQILHGSADLGRNKTASAQDQIQRLNPDCQIERIDERLDGAALDTAVKRADVVVDASDTFATRFAVNAACVANKTPLVSAAAIRHEGQISVFRADHTDSPCYRCLYTDEDEVAESCSDSGVFAPLLGILGSMQAAETIKLLLNMGETLNGRLLSLDALTMRWHESTLSADPKCPVCQRA